MAFRFVSGAGANGDVCQSVPDVPMTSSANMRAWSARAGQTAVLLLVLAALAGCSATKTIFGASPEPEASAPPPPPPPPPPPAPPPVDVAGRWRLIAVGGGACFMNFGNAPGAVQGTIAPAGGCPGKFFTSRKWTFEHDVLIIRNHKDEPLAQLSFTDGRFVGHEGNVALSLTR
jgi:hypothetical protein